MRFGQGISLGLACLTLGLAGCRVRDDGDHGLAEPGALPKLVGGSGDAAVATKVGTYGQGGGTRLILDLTRLPDGTTANLWHCWTTPPADFAIGRAVCASDKTNVVPLTPANVDTVCSNDPSFTGQAATTPVPLGACAAYDIYSFQYDPPLTLKIGT